MIDRNGTEFHNLISAAMVSGTGSRKTYEWLADRLLEKHTRSREAIFTGLLIRWIRERGELFWGNELSEDLCPLLQLVGLIQRVPYNPEKHGDNIDADPGEEIWLLTPRAIEAAESPEVSIYSPEAINGGRGGG